MPVKQRGDAWQADFRHKEDRHRRSFDTQLEAVTWETQVKARLAKGLPLDADTAALSGVTLRSLTDAVITRKWKGTCNERNSVRNADEAVNFFGEDLHPAELTAAMIDDWVTDLRDTEKNEPATINRKLAALSTVLRFALTRSHITAMPHMERLKESKGRLRWYTHEEEAAMLKFFRDVRKDRLMVLLIMVLADTGCRLTEGLNLTWKDIEAKHARIWKTKGNKPRSVPLTQRLIAAVKPHRGPAGSLIFPDLTVQIANHRWQAMRKATGIDDEQAVIHTLRHTCASRLVQGGVSLYVVQKWLGHESIKMTEVYAHLAPDTLDSAVSVLDRVSVPVVTTGADKVRSEIGSDGLVTVVSNVAELAQAA